jgi:hypothetical protein
MGLWEAGPGGWEGDSLSPSLPLSLCFLVTIREALPFHHNALPRHRSKSNGASRHGLKQWFSSGILSQLQKLTNR